MDPIPLQCQQCGAPLTQCGQNAFVVCEYCGMVNKIAEAPGPDAFTISKDTDIHALLLRLDYEIIQKNYDMAKMRILSAKVSDIRDYRLLIRQIMIELDEDDEEHFLSDMQNLMIDEGIRNDPNAQTELKKLMVWQGYYGITALHLATNYKMLEMVKFCVEYGSDVNLAVGKAHLTPIDMMFCGENPLWENKMKVWKIRNYLMKCGAKDKYRIGFGGMFDLFS